MPEKTYKRMIVGAPRMMVLTRIHDVELLRDGVPVDRPKIAVSRFCVASVRPASGEGDEGCWLQLTGTDPYESNLHVAESFEEVLAMLEA